MAWAGSYRATPAVQDFASATTYAVNKATGTVAGDLILLWFTSASAYTISAPPGFAAGPSTSEGGLFYRTADGTEGSTFTISSVGAGVAEIVQATIAGPCSIDVIGAAAVNTSTNPTATGLTVAGNNELLLWFGNAQNGSSVGVAVATAMPPGFTSQATGTTGTTYRPTTLLCDNATVASGATGSVAATNATATNYWDAQMVAIKPVAYTGPVYRAAPAVQDFASASTYAVNKATGTVAGDLILLWVAGATASFTCPGFAAYSTAWDGQLLARTADGTEGSTFTVTSVNGAGVAEIVNATIAGPCSIDVVGASNAATPSVNPTATGLTVAGSNELLLWFGFSMNNSSNLGTAVATTIPSGFTSRVTGTPGTAIRPTALLCDNTAIASGATGSVASVNATAEDWTAQMVAIKLNPAVVSTQGLLLMLMMS